MPTDMLDLNDGATGTCQFKYDGVATPSHACQAVKLIGL